MRPANPAARILVTGASQGIGKAIFLSLARSEHSVLGITRTKPNELNDPALSPDRVSWMPCDLLNTADVERSADLLEAVPVRALVLCAVDYGANQRHPTAQTSAREWQQVIGTNCIGHCLLVSRLLPKLVGNSPGLLINLSSDVAILPATGRAAYAASKAGLHAMLRAVATEYPAESLRVYQLIPTFQLSTEGIRRRRPVGFDFSSYADPAVIAEVVQQIVSSSGIELSPGTYWVCRDGTTEALSELTKI
jgi:cyclitol oxidoreductase